MSNNRDLAYWNDRYQSGNMPWDTRRVEAQFVRVVGELECPTRRAIDLGCGAGDNAVWLAQQGFDTIGMDLSPLAIEMARERAADKGLANLRFVSGSVVEPLPAAAGSLGLAIDRGCFHSLDAGDRVRYVQQLAAATADGGYWVLMCANADEVRAEGEMGPPQVTAEQIIEPVEAMFAVHRLERSRFAAHEDMPPFLAWLAVLCKRPQT